MNRSDTGARELLCERCGHDYPVWFAPSPVWNAAIRNGHRGNPEPVGERFLCPTCFALIAEERGAVPSDHTAWVLAPEIVEESELRRRVESATAERDRLAADICRAAQLGAWIERDRREPDKVLTYAHELQRMVLADTEDTSAAS